VDAPNFAFFYAADAYSTDGKIMGRQSAGKALLKGVARRWPKAEIHAFSPTRSSAHDMLQRLASDGYAGTLRHRPVQGDETLDALGALYHPAPITADLAWARNARRPASYSLFGVTHTLSSHQAMEQTAALVLPPFKPWDGLICTSRAARDVVVKLQAELREWHARTMGATHFNLPAMPVIPLGVNAPDFERGSDEIAEARSHLEIAGDEVVFLFAGRLVFHAKANPAPMYQAMEAAVRAGSHRLVCIEAGVYPNESTAQAYQAAREALAPSVRFIQIDGNSQEDYARAWRAADVFTSLSDNVQETFGLTPVEAMAAGLPTLVSDWNGYRDTVRDGVDGFRVPVVAPGKDEGVGDELARRFSDGVDTYDLYVGRVSMATVVDPTILLDRIVRLASDANLRREMGEAGRQRARLEYDWPVVLERYCDFAANLGDLRRAAERSGPLPGERRPLRGDPFSVFDGYPTATIDASWRVSAALSDGAELQKLLSLNVVSYVLAGASLQTETLARVHASATQEQTIRDLLAATGGPRDQAFRAMMWLIKLGLLTAHP